MSPFIEEVIVSAFLLVVFACSCGDEPVVGPAIVAVEAKAVEPAALVEPAIEAIPAPVAASASATSRDTGSPEK